MIGIYKITSPTNKIYIGQSIDIKGRFKYYEKLKCKKQPRLYNSLKKHKQENHKFEIIIECEIKQLNDLERYYQEIYNVTSKNGLNCILTKTNDRCGKHTEESKLKMRKPHTPERKEKMKEIKNRQYIWCR